MTSGRPRKYATNAEKMKAYRAKKVIKQEELPLSSTVIDLSAVRQVKPLSNATLERRERALKIKELQLINKQKDFEIRRLNTVIESLNSSQTVDPDSESFGKN